jgi:hypothetical protein
MKWAAIAAGAVVVAAVGTAAFLSLRTPVQLLGGQPGTTPCSPQPCLDVRGYTLWVSDLKIGSDSDPGLVTMHLMFRNSSVATHADPADLQLIDSHNNTHRAVDDAPGCMQWPRTDFKNGATFGPVAECFRVPTTTPPLTLRWNPDMGFFCCEAELLLEAAGSS